ncbi:MAG: ElyC/SanA/YdcF family protein [Anaerolineales bacterium]|jgi:vancomycin permeability regulator SanA
MPLSRQTLVITIVVVVVVLALVLPRWILSRRHAAGIIQPSQAPTRPVAIVFGAGLRRDGTPTAVLEDRVRTAVLLYQQGKAQTLLLSGDGESSRYDEPAAMHAMALDLGVPAHDMIVDRLGTRTYQTCHRAKHQYGIERALLVTQRFHLPRALAICSALGIDTLGVTSDLQPYRKSTLLFWQAREILATVGALWDIHIQPQ